MAMACLRLFTRPPLPPFTLRSVQRFLRRMALATSLLALGLYLLRFDRVAGMLSPPVWNVLPRERVQAMCRGAFCLDSARSRRRAQRARHGKRQADPVTTYRVTPEHDEYEL